MRSRTQTAIRLRIVREEKNKPYTQGKWGTDPILYRHQDAALINPLSWMNLNYPVGTLFVGTSLDDNVDYYYVIKDYKDGWWRLEWPD